MMEDDDDECWDEEFGFADVGDAVDTDDDSNRDMKLLGSRIIGITADRLDTKEDWGDDFDFDDTAQSALFASKIKQSSSIPDGLRNVCLGATCLVQHCTLCTRLIGIASLLLCYVSPLLHCCLLSTLDAQLVEQAPEEDETKDADATSASGEDDWDKEFGIETEEDATSLFASLQPQVRRRHMHTIGCYHASQCKYTFCHMHRLTDFGARAHYNLMGHTIRHLSRQSQVKGDVDSDVIPENQQFLQEKSGIRIFKFPMPTLLYSLHEKENNRVFNTEKDLVSWLSNVVSKHKVAELISTPSVEEDADTVVTRARERISRLPMV
jgi:hypothetical protein